MSNMNVAKLQRGSIDALLIPLIISGVLLIGTVSFAVWAYAGRQDYKNNVQKKVAAAVDIAKEQTVEEQAVKYAEEAKNPLKTYVGPAAYGAVTLQYPKTWSGYIETGSSSNPLDAFFHPDFVPDTGNKASSYSLRIAIVSRPYSSIVSSFDSEVKTKKVTAVPYSLPKVPSVAGMRFDGQIEKDKQGALVVLPVRNITIQIWTESNDFVRDFNDIILPNIIFSP